MVTNKSRSVNNIDPEDHTRLMLSWLRTEPISTLEARRRGVNHPVGRVRDLRRRGHRIDTVHIKEISQTGRLVTVAQYSLRPSRQRSVLELLAENA